jgi:hypothetical protein
VPNEIDARTEGYTESDYKRDEDILDKLKIIQW